MVRVRPYAHHVFPWLVDRILALPGFQEQRVPSLAVARGQVLEIGFGCGGSLAAYPSGGEVVSLVGLEPNPGMLRRAAQSTASAPFPVHLLRASAERIPVADRSFDTVVSHWTVCSLSRPVVALREVRRVLRPTGRFLFLEHGRAADPRLARWQRRWSPVQKLVAGGCRLDAPVDLLIREAGFEIEALARYDARPGPRILTQMYRGSARVERKATAGAS